MYLIHGVYHFRKRKIGLKKDFCNKCGNERVVELWRSFECGHLYGIPLLPTGWHSRWKCSRCGSKPDGRYRTGKGTLIAGAIALLSLLPILVLAAQGDEDAWVMRGMGIVFGIAGCVVMYIAFKRKPIDESALRNSIVPFDVNDPCPDCGKPLNADPYLHCANCKILIY